MSLHEVTTRCFQNGVGEQKWGTLCRHVIAKNGTLEDEAGTEISSCILELFGFYPADVLLLAYLKHALHGNGLVSLSTFIRVFLEAAKSPTLHDTATLNMLCRLIQEEFFATGLPAEKVLLQVDDSTISRALGVVHNSLDLLRTTSTLPSSPFHNPTASASQLVRLLLSCVGDMSALSTGEAMIHYANVLEIMQLQLDADVRSALESFSLSLNMILGDDAKMAQEAQMMHSLQMSLGKGDISGPNSQTDLVSCSLMLRHLVENRATENGSRTSTALVWLVATFRWTSWTPKAFYTQLFLSAVTILAQSIPHEDTALLWRSFIITRLTHLLGDFEKIMSGEITESEWRNVTQSALSSVHARTDLLAQCDIGTVSRDSDEMQVDNPESGGRPQASVPPFFQTLVQYCAHRTNLMDTAAKMIFRHICEPNLTTILTGDSVDATTIEAQIEERLSSDLNSEEQATSFFTKALKDVPNHPHISSVLRKTVFRLCRQNEVESLGTLCKVLNSLEMVVEVISLHVNLIEIIAHILAFVEDFDCEPVGDPQTAVGHLGSVILFLQDVLIKHQFSNYTFKLEERVLPTQYLLNTSIVYRRSQQSEDINAMRSWLKALFDTNSEGIEDNILRNTKPKVLLKLAATLVMQPTSACAERRGMEAETLKNGISYFTGSLLNWTLVGVVKALLRDIFEKELNAPVHLDVLHTLLDAPSCPTTVLKLTGHGILALAAHPKAASIDTNKISVLKTKVTAALKLPVGASEPPLDPLTMPNQIHWLDQPRKAIHDAITLARTGRAPAFDVGRCVCILGPTRFIRLLWTELESAAQLGDMELARRLATYILLCPPAEVGPGAGRTPPLLPIFLTSGLQYILSRLDGLPPTEQTLGTELLVVVITSALTGLLQFEWAFRAVAPNTSAAETPSYRSSVAVGRRLAADLKRSKSPSATMILQRMTSSPSFVANFPMMTS